MTKYDVIYLALTIYGEARGEFFTGKLAVGQVVLNRVRAESWYGKTIHEVCLKHKQFSCWNENDPNSDKLNEMAERMERDGVQVLFKDDTFRECLTAALMVIEGRCEDYAMGATHYLHHSAVDRVSWDDNAELVGAIGNHRFYVGVD